MRNITVRDSSIQAQTKPIVINLESPSLAYGDPGGLNRYMLDEIVIDGVRTDNRGYYGSAVHVGGAAAGRRVEVRDCFMDNSSDDGLEINAFDSILAEDNTYTRNRQAICLVWFSYPYSSTPPVVTLRNQHYTGDLAAYWPSSTASEPGQRTPMMPEWRAFTTNTDASNVKDRSWGHLTIDGGTIEFGVREAWSSWNPTFTLGSNSFPMSSVTIKNVRITANGPGSGDFISVKQGAQLGTRLPLRIENVQVRRSASAPFEPIPAADIATSGAVDVTRASAQWSVTSPTPTPSPIAATAQPSPSPAPTRTSTVSPTPTPTSAPPPASGATVTVAGTTASAIDAALAQADPGETVSFPAGSYTHGALTWPNGIHLRGAGIGQTKLNFAFRFGSSSRIEDVTIGSTTSATAHRFVTGAHDTLLEDVRLRSHGSSFLFDACDFAGADRWASPVVRNKAHFHDVTFRRVEFEYTGRSDSDLFSLWPDTRAAGGEVYDVSWESCTFGVKNSAGQYGQGRVGLIIQPSPPEHAFNGPRPGAAITGSTDYGFDWSKVTHGIGLSASPNADYGFRMTGTRFVGPASFVSMNACDYIRAWAMTTYRIPTSSPGSVTQVMRDAAPDKVTLKGLSVADSWFSDDFRPEIVRRLTRSNVTENAGTAYNVSELVRQHDRELYGF
jgi:hypothetical protein